MAWLSSAFALIAGAFITVQVGSNTELKKGLGQPLPALLVNYTFGLTAVLIYNSRFDVHTASIGRIAGCALMIIGLILIAKY